MSFLKFLFMFIFDGSTVIFIVGVLVAILLVAVSYFLAGKAIEKLQGAIRAVCLIILIMTISWIGPAIACKRYNVKWAFWLSLATGVFQILCPVI